MPKRTAETVCSSIVFSQWNTSALTEINPSSWTSLRGWPEGHLYCSLSQGKTSLWGNHWATKDEGPLRNSKFKWRVWKSYVSCQDASSCPMILLLSKFGLAFLRRQREMKSVLAQKPKILSHNSNHKTEFQMDSMTFLQEEMAGNVGNESLPKAFTQCSHFSYPHLERQFGQK